MQDFGFSLWIFLFSQVEISQVWMILNYLNEEMLTLSELSEYGRENTVFVIVFSRFRSVLNSSKYHLKATMKITLLSWRRFTSVAWRYTSVTWLIYRYIVVTVSVSVTVSDTDSMTVTMNVKGKTVTVMLTVTVIVTVALSVKVTVTTMSGHVTAWQNL